MRRLFTPMLARFVLSVVLVGSLTVVVASGAFGQTPTPNPTRTAPARSAGPKDLLPAELQFLRSLSPLQRFDHFAGAQVTFVNPQGQPVVVNMIPGTVSAVTTTSVTIQPNGATQARTFNVTPATFVRGSPHTGVVEAFANGDRAVVYQIGSSNDATAIVGHNFGRHGGSMMPGHLGLEMAGD